MSTLSKLSGEFYDVISGIPKTPIVERIVNCAARSVNHINFAMNAMTSKLDLRPTDRRNAKRASTLKSGKLVYGGSWGAVVDCLVLDLTDRGARVETVLTADVPEAFSLRLSDGTERRGYRRWVSGHEIGIEFADGVV